LAPSPELQAEAAKGTDPNAHSLVLHLNANGIRVVLGADATTSVLQNVFDAYGKNLDCHVYKAAHHGRNSGYCMQAVRAMAPKFTIVSVGKRPSTDATVKYQYFADQNSGEVLSTRFHGDIVVRIDSTGKYFVETEETRKAALDARIRALAPLLGLRR
jgi:beta-lactamase superfamily II metal-dependent hydrolase